jgi:hypothetical protein
MASFASGVGYLCTHNMTTIFDKLKKMSKSWCRRFGEEYGNLGARDQSFEIFQID